MEVSLFHFVDNTDHDVDLWFSSEGVRPIMCWCNFTKIVISIVKINLVFKHLVILFGDISCRLYTEEYYLNEMQSEGIPEMQRSNLVSCIIQVTWKVWIETCTSA